MDGQISAGTLSSKLEQAEPGRPAAEPEWRPSHRAQRQSRAPHRRLTFPIALVSAVLLAAVCAFTVASASTSSERSGRPAAAKTTRTRRHRAAGRTRHNTLVSASSTAGTSAPRHAHHVKGHAKSPARAHDGKDGPGGKLAAKPVGKPAGPDSKGANQSSAGTGGTATQPDGGAPVGANPSPGQSTTPSGTSTSSSGPGTTTGPASSARGTTTSAS